MQYRSPVAVAALSLVALSVATPATAQSQPGSLLGLVQVLTRPNTTVNVANDNGGPALAQVGALPVGGAPSLVVSAVKVAPVDIIPLPTTSTQIPLIPGVLSLTAGPGLGVNVLADNTGPSVADVNLIPVGTGTNSALNVRAINTDILGNFTGIPGVLDLATAPALNAGALNTGANSSLATVQALPVNGAPGALVTAIGFAPVSSPLSDNNVIPVTAQLLPGVLELQTVPGLTANVLNDGGGPAVVDLGLIPLTQGGSGLRISALSTQMAAIPEPTTWATFALGLLGLGWLTAGKRDRLSARPR